MAPAGRPTAATAGFFALTLATAAGALTACSSADEHRDELQVLLPSPPTCADPRQAGTIQTQHVARQVADSLVDQDPDTGEIVPWLADSWTVSPDAKSFTFHLRPGQTFSDGTGVDAATVADNFTDIVTKKSAGGTLATSFLTGFAGARAVDGDGGAAGDSGPGGDTVEIDFEKPNASFLQAASTVQLGIVGQSTLDREPAARCRGENVVGSGPYAYSGWESNRSVDLDLREPAQGKPDHVHLEVVPESSVRAAAVSSGDADVDAMVAPQDAETIAAGDAHTIAVSNPGVPFLIQPNFSRAPLSDLAVRRALSLSLDREEIVATALTPEYRPALGPLASRTPGAIDTEKPSADREEAERTLDAASWVPGPDGIRSKGGKRLTFGVMYAPTFSETPVVMQIVQQQAKQVGIDLQLDQVTTASATARQQSADFDAIVYNVTRADPDILRQRVGFDQATWQTRPEDPELDPLLVEQGRIVDENERKEVVEKAQRKIAADQLIIPMFEFSQVFAQSDKAAGLRADFPGVLRFDQVTRTG